VVCPQLRLESSARPPEPQLHTEQSSSAAGIEAAGPEGVGRGRRPAPEPRGRGAATGEPCWSGKGRRVVRQDLQRPEARPGAGRVGQSVGAMRGAAEQVSTEAGEEAREARPGHLGLGHGERRPLDHRKFNSAQKNMLQSQQEYMFRIIM
jgi:hypothetical protein